MSTNIIKLKFRKDGMPQGREYTYFTPEPVEVGDIVDVETKHGTTQGTVSQVNVPESEIAIFKDKAKSIIGKAKPRCENCEHFNPIGEGDHICDEDPTRMPVSDYTPTEDYFWCQGANFSEL